MVMKPTPPTAAHPRFEDADREGGGDGGVDRVAAPVEDVEGGVDRPGVLRRDHRAAGDGEVAGDAEVVSWEG
jgi:hypothetical protein